MIIIMWDRVCKSLILKVFASSIKFGQRMKRLFYEVAPYSLKEIIQKNLQYYILFIFIKSCRVNANQVRPRNFSSSLTLFTHGICSTLENV